MKVLRKLGIILFSFALITVLFLMSITFPLKTVVHQQFIGTIVKEEFATQIADTFSIEEDKVKDAMAIPEVQEILDRVVDTTIDGITDEEKLKGLDLDKEIASLIHDYKVDIERELDVSIDEEKLDSALKDPSFQEITKQYQDSVSKIRNNFSDSQKSMMKSYQYVISDSYKIMMVVVGVVLALLILLLQRSSRVIMTYGIVSLIGGILSSAAIMFLKLIMNYALEDTTYSIVIDFNSMFIYSIGMVLLGIILIVAYAIIKNKKINQQIRKENGVA